MKKVFGNWFMDIAKYIVTALVLSTALSDRISGWLYYAASLGLVVGIVLFAVYIYKLAEKEDKKKVKQSNN